MPARAVAVPFLIEFEVRVMSRVIKSSASQAVKPGPSPRFVPPQLSQPVDKPPSGRQWLHEIKLDGFRMAARIDNGRAQLFTRTGLVDSSVGARCPAPQSMASMAAE
jgi:ATP-dependent DNA ligase